MSNSVTVTPLESGVFRIDRGDGSHAIAYGVVDGTKAWVFLDGQTFVVDSAPTRRAAGSHEPSALAAPMPATVTHVHVSTGQAVKAGDALVTLEAMKMELPIRATADGTVTSVNCSVGEMVQPGIPLVELAAVEREHERRTEKREA